MFNWMIANLKHFLRIFLFSLLSFTHLCVECEHGFDNPDGFLVESHRFDTAMDWSGCEHSQCASQCPASVCRTCDTPHSKMFYPPPRYNSHRCRCQGHHAPGTLQSQGDKDQTIFIYCPSTTNITVELSFRL